MTHAEAERREIERRLQALRAFAGDRPFTAVEQSEQAALLAMLRGGEEEIELAIADLEAVDVDEAQRAERETLHAMLREGALEADDDDDEPLPPLGRRAADLREELDGTSRGPTAAELRAQLEGELEQTDESRLAAYLAMRSPDARSQALHEACHAVVGEAVGDTVAAVRFRFTDNKIDAVTQFGAGAKLSPVTIAAGAAGAWVAGYAGRLGDRISDGDRRLLNDVGVRDEHRVQLCIAAATKHLRANWPAVERIAAELLATGLVSGDRVRQIISEGEAPQ
jgi:hypothetical protein